MTCNPDILFRLLIFFFGDNEKIFSSTSEKTIARFILFFYVKNIVTFENKTDINLLKCWVLEKKEEFHDWILRSVLMRLSLSCVVHRHKVFRWFTHLKLKITQSNRDSFLQSVIILGKKQSYHFSSSWQNLIFTSPNIGGLKKRWNDSLFSDSEGRYPEEITAGRWQ